MHAALGSRRRRHARLDHEALELVLHTWVHACAKDTDGHDTRGGRNGRRRRSRARVARPAMTTTVTIAAPAGMSWTTLSSMGSPMTCARITGRSPWCSRRSGAAPRVRVPARPDGRPGRVERVSDVEAAAVERELQHLRPAVQFAGCVALLAEDTSEPELSRQPRVGRIGDVVLPQIAVQ